MVVAMEEANNSSQWAEFDSNSVFTEATESARSTKEKKKKKKDKDKSGEKKKKKKSTHSSDDDDEEDFTADSLFARAISDGALNDAFNDLTEDREFVKAFGDFKDEYSFISDPLVPGKNKKSVQEQAPRPRKSIDFDDDGSGFFVQETNKGQQMDTFAASQSVTSARTGVKTISSNHVQTSDASRSVSCTPDDFQSDGGGRDWESYQLEVRGNDSFTDDDTVSSDLTGLTGVFSTRGPGFDDDDDSESDEDEPALAYPTYNPAESKFMMMQGMRKKDKPKLAVKFGSVTVRDFERILGDNPSCKTGAPLSIGWKTSGVRTHTTPEEHDKARGRAPLPSTQLVLSRDARHQLLLELGYSQKEIATAVRNVIKVKNQRRTTVNNLGVSNAEEKVEAAKKGIRRMLFLKPGPK